MPSLILKKFDSLLITNLHRWAIPVLRVALGIVFFWFGALKVLGVSPVVELVESTYSFLPASEFVIILGIWEMLIGIGLLSKRCLRTTLVLLWLQMFGTFISLALAPSMFFTGNVFVLTIEGEFVVKNLVLVAASLVVGGHQIKQKP